MFAVYLLQSLKDNRTYVGYTDNRLATIRPRPNLLPVAPNHIRCGLCYPSSNE